MCIYKFSFKTRLIEIFKFVYCEVQYNNFEDGEPTFDFKTSHSHDSYHRIKLIRSKSLLLSKRMAIFVGRSFFR